MKLNSRNKPRTLVEAHFKDLPFISTNNGRVFTNLKADDPRVLEALRNIETSPRPITVDDLLGKPGTAERAFYEKLASYKLSVETNKQHITGELGPEISIPLKKDAP